MSVMFVVCRVLFCCVLIVACCVAFDAYGLLYVIMCSLLVVRSVVCSL